MARKKKKKKNVAEWRISAQKCVYSQPWKEEAYCHGKLDTKDLVQDLAAAILYPHEGGDFCVLHRDIKTGNVFLDSAFNAKLGDFGLARLVDHESGLKSTLLAGTSGYMAPDCHTIGKVSKETDVYSFGVMSLEVACGRRLIEPKYDVEQASSVAWVWEAYANHKLLDVVDKKLGSEIDINEMQCLITVGLWCVHPVFSMRPPITQAMQVLKFQAPLPALPSKMPVPVYNIPSAVSAVRTSEPRLSNAYHYSTLKEVFHYCFM